ncbi:MAG: YdcH family protein [Allosphingosinicella sp.]|uniref:YdcH family protein n=1 Tax=Allosphingosinicella sp. TaxID=2823234 RepID=UPI003959D027
MNDRDESTQKDVAIRLEALKMEHRDLDAAIEALRASVAADQLQLARLKKRKLRLRDEIALLEDIVVPDIIA